jgi:hypothetical protein
LTQTETDQLVNHKEKDGRHASHGQNGTRGHKRCPPGGPGDPFGLGTHVMQELTGTERHEPTLFTSCVHATLNGRPEHYSALHETPHCQKIKAEFSRTEPENLAGVEGLEPTTSGFGDRHSSQLSYTPAARPSRLEKTYNGKPLV